MQFEHVEASYVIFAFCLFLTLETSQRKSYMCFQLRRLAEVKHHRPHKTNDLQGVSTISVG